MSYEFDFDHWLKLSQDDPHQFFAERSRAIEAFLDEVPVEKRDDLRRFQGEIDALRASAGTPVNALAGLMGMLSDHLEALHGHTAQLADEARRLKGQA
jgi:hypothetical protein